MAVALKMLAKISYFAGLNRDELNEVKKYVAMEKKIEKGQILLHEGDQADYIYFVATPSGHRGCCYKLTSNPVNVCRK